MLLAERIMNSFVPDASGGLKHSKNLTASIITGCRRRNWYNIKGYPNNREYAPDDQVTRPDVGLHCRFFDGDLNHAAVVQLMEGDFENKVEGVEVIQQEIPGICRAEDGTSIYSRMDWVVKITDDGESTVYNGEFKTMADNPFMTWLQSGIEAFPSYYAQAQVGLGSKPERPFLLLIKCKNSSAYADQLVVRNEEYIEELLQIKREFDKKLLYDKPPEKSYSYSSTQCKGCDYRYRCWFRYIMDETADGSKLRKSEMAVVRKMLRERNVYKEASLKFEEYDSLLKDYVAFLHDKYNARWVKTDSLKSTLVTFDRFTPDARVLKRILSPREFGQAMKKTPVEFVRISES